MTMQEEEEKATTTTRLRINDKTKTTASTFLFSLNDGAGGFIGTTTGILTVL